MPLQPRRPTPFAGLFLPLRAMRRVVREPSSRATLFLTLSLFLVGTLFYTIAEGWSVVDAFYFSVMTLATVGFGDLAPTTAATKLFTVVYTLVGIGTLVAFFSTLASASLALAEEERAVRRTRAQQ